MGGRLNSVWVLVLLGVLTGCGTDSEATKQKLLESGNTYFAEGKYKEASLVYRRAIQEDRRFGEAYYRLGLAEHELRRIAQAISALTRAVELQPDNRDAYGHLADLYLAVYLGSGKGDERYLAELQSLTERAEQHFPNTFHINRIKGFTALSQSRSGNAEESIQLALKYLEVAHDQEPSDRRTALGLVQSLALAGRPEEASTKAREFLAQDPDFSEMYDFLYAQHVKNGQIDQALTILQEKIGHNPADIGVRFQLARHYLATRENEQMRAVLNDVLSNADKFETAYENVGDFYARTLDFDRAIDTYRLGADRHPDRRSIYRNKTAEALAAQGKYDEAFRLVEKTIAEEESNAIAFALRGALRLRSQNRTEIEAAARDFEAALTRHSNNPILRYNLAEAYRVQGKTQRAIVEYEASINERRDYLPPRYRLATLYLNQGNYAKAVAETEEILKIDSDNVNAQLIRANAWVRVGEARQAVNSLEQIVAEHPSSSDAIYQLAALRLRNHQFSKATELFQQLYDGPPPDLRGLFGLVDVHIARNEPGKAVALLRNNLDRNPGHVGLQMALAATLSRVGEWEESAELFQLVLKKRPDDSGAHMLLGDVYYLQGKLADAEKHLMRASELAPADPDPLMRLAMLSERQGAIQQAALRYERVIELAPDSALALNNLAYLLANTTAEYDRALSLVQKARGLAPDDPNVADTLGYVYIKKDLPQSAIPILDEIVSQNPSVVIWRYHLALALRKGGEPETARRHLEMALKQNPTDEEALMIRELLAGSGV